MKGSPSPRSILILMLLALTACHRLPAPVCYECFWRYQDPALRTELEGVYEAYRSDDPLIEAEVAYLLAAVRGDDPCEARSRFERLRETETHTSRLSHVDATLAFTASACGGDLSAEFLRAAVSAEQARRPWQARIYREIARGTFAPVFGEAPIERPRQPPAGTTSYVLGGSAIHLASGSRVATQMERVARDWLSYQMTFDLSHRPLASGQVLDYHEGARLRDLLDATELEVLPLFGTLVAERDGRWFAPDETGRFRFEVLPDKVQYPTTRAYDGLAMLVDTHGIASLVEPALSRQVDLVIGCADHPGKVQAAYHLATQGVDVYFPCDRFAGDLLGYDAPGVLIGSAPVRRSAGGAVIGDRPVEFSVTEVVVVEDTEQRGVLQYYDAPARYFARLATLLPLRWETVSIDEAGQSGRVVARAEEIGAKAIAVRVWTEEDHGPVARWLAASPEHRAVLFHTAAYPQGYRLFREFPLQTTFGDPRPRFIAPGAARP